MDFPNLNDTTNTEPYEYAETLTDAAMRELRSAVAELTRARVLAEAELRQAQAELSEARVVIRQLYFVGDFENWPVGLMPRVEAVINKE